MKHSLHGSHVGSYLLLSLLIGLLIYTIIPTALIRLGGFGASKKENPTRGIALTFDDGPDPAYTPELLDFLRLHRIQATFFVLGSKAEKYPELIRRMHKEGHLIGIHNYVHWTNAVLTPRKVRKQIKDTVAVIEHILGITPIHYRPPWGVINLFDFLLMKQFRFVFWSLMVGDWRCSGGKEKIRRKLFARLQNNDIIVLHDSGQTLGANRDAPMFMLQALKEFVEECMRQEIPFLRIDKKLQLDAPVTRETHGLNLESQTNLTRLPVK
ncbi:polysaccharide deacetylase family protein [Paenibacillus roseipurpureus]|uniref:Polysaccharide deacetylase family protein n=1 Tax=Paenibacillus roseopurpureus TaxID=2918901 RepID=A0AA96RIR8_9BACL|nr:polysaccharide deacetylase family protein [Paenibacillus sp. MBLB1832]WNR43100.1 polysaccharide deacetylase family protein [Paenibacillus sp. MBLB1832]